MTPGTHGNIRSGNHDHDLESPDEIAAYLDLAMQNGDPAFIASALGDVWRH